MQNVFKKLITVAVFIYLILSLWGPAALPGDTNSGAEPPYQLLSDIPLKEAEQD